MFKDALHIACLKYFSKQKIILALFVSCFTISTGYTQVKEGDSVTVPCSEKYFSTSFIRTLFIGRNYRSEWTTPVKLPVLDLKRQHGGLTIVEAGGGKQTNSLHLRDKSGKEWVLRSVDKDVDRFMLPAFKNTMIETLMQDFFSASYPYAALTIPTLAAAAGVDVAKPQIFFIPDDPVYKKHRSVFAKTVCYLEEREPVSGSETKSTNTAVENRLEQGNHRLFQKKILKARLLDMLVADWDRHTDQWRWSQQDSLGITYYCPVPRDRDFAYFQSDGLFVKFASITFLPYLNGFTRNVKGLKKVNAKVWDVDAFWLNELSKEDWYHLVAEFQKNISDSIIDLAVRELPPEIYPLSAKKLSAKLKTRRDGLMKEAVRYFRFLSTHPVIIGSNDQEFISVTASGKDISIRVSMRGSQGDSMVIYQRNFSAAETKTISIKGLGGNDHFDIARNVSSSIKLDLEGGPGNDVYTIRGKIKARIEDDKTSPKGGLTRK